MLHQGLWTGLLNNASWLLSLFIFYEISYLLDRKRPLLRQIVRGLFSSCICIAVMSLPFPLAEGVLFDTRSILLSVIGLLFGGVPTAITVVISIFYRLLLGGAGILSGIASILTSASIGLFWRRYVHPHQTGMRWLSIFLMGLTVHSVVLLDMLLLPPDLRIPIIETIFAPVMLTFPIVSLLLCVLLILQQERRQYQDDLMLSEQKHRKIMDSVSDVIWTVDLDLRVTYVSHAAERLFGVPCSVYMQRALEEQFPPSSLQLIKALYEEAMLHERDPAFPKERTRIVEVEHYRADGTTLWVSMNTSVMRDGDGHISGFQGVSRDISEHQRNALALKAEQQKTQTYIELAPVIFLLIDRDMNILLINQEGCNILGLSQSEIIGQNWCERFIPEDYREALRQIVAGVFLNASEQLKFNENTILTAKNGERLISWRNTVMKDEMGRVTGILSSGIDITDQSASLRALQESERSKRVLLENLPGMAYRCKYDRDWTMEFVSLGCRELTGYNPDSLLHNRDLSFNDLISDEYRTRLWDKWALAREAGTTFEAEYEIICASGETKWVWEQGQFILNEDGSVICLEGLIIDISDRKRNEMELTYLSKHDPLTGLLNLRCFEHAYYQHENERSALIVLNIRRFSVINRVFGYRFGNQLVQQIAGCLRLYDSGSHMLFHTSIDRFVFYLPHYDSRQDLIDFCEQIIACLDATIEQKTISLNLGILEIDSGTARDAEAVLKCVSTAAEYADDSMRFSYFFYNKEIEAKQLREAIIRQALSEVALHADDAHLYLVYQPIIDLKTNEIAGFEGLARLNTPELGVVSPLEFIPIAEASQMMLPLGKKITRLACRFAARLAREGHGAVSVSFNASAIQLLAESFLPDLAELIAETGADPRNLHMEITESIFSDNYQAINEKLDLVKRMGIKVAIDDFGTGYSSLARERELNVNCLKIDKYFIDALLQLSPEHALTGDIISMAHKLGHYVIAEGVETESQRQYLLEHHCDMMQGYLFSRPVDEDAALALLRAHAGMATV